MHRHARQSRLVGVDGQARIERATVDVCLGGFAGEVAARYLAGAGVGRVRVLSAPVETEDPTPPVLDDPAAADLARGALFALRALRAVLEEPA